MIPFESFLQLPTDEVAALVRATGRKVCVFPVNGTRRWFMLEHSEKIGDDFFEAYRQLRAILYDHIYLRRAPEADYAQLTSDELNWLRDYYRSNKDYAFGVGKLKFNLWIPETGKDL